MNKNYLIYSVLSGILLGLSWPTYGLTIFIFIAFVPLLYLEKLTRNDSSLKIFSYSYLSFFIWNSIATWWLVYSTFFGMSFAIIINSLLMALVFTSYSIISKKISKKLSIIYWFSSWIVFEKFHLFWDFSWPWLNLGNVFSENVLWIQWYEYTGSFGGTLWVLFVNYLFLLVYNNYIKTKKIDIIRISSSILGISIPIIISLLIYNFQENDKEYLNVSILQPNIDPYTEKYGRTNISILQDFKSFVDSSVNSNDIIVAPETYFSESPGFIINSFQESPFLLSLKDYLNKKNAQLLSGVQLYKLYNSSLNKSKTSNYIKDSLWIDVFNSSFLISKNQKPQIYHKSKLVVGVEHMPYKNILEPILGNALLNMGGTVISRGTQPNRGVFELDNGVKIAPIICYESVYGEYVTEYIRNGAQLLAIITNDGWWSESQGYKQHLSYARIRSIETRRNIVRSANTGSSAIINKSGEIITKLDYNTKGVINAKVGISNLVTSYVKYGDFIFRFSLFFFSIIVFYYFGKKKKY